MRGSDLDPVFSEAGLEWNVDPALLKAMAAHESGGNPRAVSKAGAQGLMQIMPATQRYLGVTDPNDPVQSIWGAAKYMAEALDAEKTPEDALRLYHGGPGWRASYGQESAGYVPGVARQYQALAKTAPTQQGAPTAVPAQATKAAAVADDPFTRAMNATAPAAPAAAASDPFTKALNAPDTAAPAEPAAAPSATVNTDAVDETPDPRVVAAAGRIGEAGAKGAVEGFGSPWGQTILSPAAQNALDAAQREGGVTGKLAQLGSTVATDIGTGLGVVGGLGNALLRGGQGIVAQTGAELGAPQLGRDVAAFPEAFMGSPHVIENGLPRAPVTLNRLDPAVAGAMATAREMTPAEREAFGNSRVAPRVADTQIDPAAMTVRPGDAPAGPSPGMGGPSPNAAGAQAATAAEAEMSNATMKANRRQAEIAEVNAPAAATDESFVEGSHLTLAQRKANPTTSQHETMLAQRNPDAFTGDTGIYGRQNAARIDKVRSLTPSDTQLDNWRTEQKALAQTDKAAVMENAQPADLAAAEAHLDTQMGDKRIQESPEIMATLTKLKETLYDADGNLKTDPMSVWGMHDNIKNMLEKSKDKTSVERFAQSQLVEFKNIIDDAMNKATGDRFQIFLDHWADYAKRINAGELLGKFESLRLTNAKGQLQANTFHKFVRDLAYSRGKRGLDPSMDIPDAVMQNLIAVDKDLKQAGLIDLGAVRGSPTNLFGVLAKDMGIGVAHMGLVAADMAHGGMGNILLQGAMKRGGEAFNMLRMRSLTRKHLAEPKGGWRPVAEQYRTPDWNALDKP